MVLARKVAVFLFIFYFLCIHLKLDFLKILLTVLPILIFSIFIYSHLELNYDILRLFNFDFTRFMTWDRSLNYMKDPSIFLFGNGINNTSHNFLMHTITTHGIIYSIILFFLIYKIFKNFLKDIYIPFNIKYFFIIFIVIDWTFNTNAYLPYYASILALTFVYIEKYYHKYQT